VPRTRSQPGRELLCSVALDGSGTPVKQFSVRSRRLGAKLVLRGEIDLAVRDQFKAGLLEAVSHAHPVVEVNLRRVTFLDCSGIGALVAANNAARVNGQALDVTHPRGLVRLVLFATEVLPLLTIARVPG
jgi:anti-anti-sigma factor